jgi:hypothetical protein
MQFRILNGIGDHTTMSPWTDIADMSDHDTNTKGEHRFIPAFPLGRGFNP